MCGLVGIAGDTSGKWKDIFSELILIDSIRGTHSTGAAVVRRFEDKFDLTKRPGGPYNLLHDQAYKTMLTFPAKVMLGHNRFATKGVHTEANAHPFEFEHIVGMHNGTLDYASHRSLHHNEKYDTDSQAIFAHINEYDIRATTDQLSGAWALVWYDKRDGTLNFLRNAERPLWYAYSEDRMTIIWASEYDMIEYACNRNGKKISQIYRVDPDMHMTWVVPKLLTEKFPSPVVMEMKAPEKKFSRSYGAAEEWQDWHGGYHVGHHYSHKSTNTGTGKASTPQQTALNLSSSVNRGPNVVPFISTKTVNLDKPVFKRVDTNNFRAPYKDIKGEVINKTRFLEMTKRGCVMCGEKNQEWAKEFIQVLEPDMEGRDTFICEECYHDDDVLTLVNHIMA